MQFERRVFHTLAVEKAEEPDLFAYRQSGQSSRRVAESDDLGFNLHHSAVSAFLLPRAVGHAQTEGGYAGWGMAQAVTTSQSRRQLESIAVFRAQLCTRFRAQAAASAAGAAASLWAD